MSAPKKSVHKLPLSLVMERQRQQAKVLRRGGPSASELIEKHLLRAEAAKQSGDTRQEWDDVRFYGKLALIALQTGDIETACSQSFYMGIAFDCAIRKPLEIDKSRNIQGLQKHTIVCNTLKAFGQKIALESWEYDKNNEYRIGEMAGIVLTDLRRMVDEQFPKGDRLKPLVEKAFPKARSTVIDWLKEDGIAPDYARKPGRPRKQ